MKKIIKVTSFALLLASAFTSSVLACGAPPEPSCDVGSVGGIPDIIVGASYAGDVSGGFNGDQGQVDVAKLGYSNTGIAAQTGGNLCGDSGCQNTELTANAAAGEHLALTGLASGTTPDSVTGIEGLGSGNASLNLGLNNKSLSIDVTAGFGGTALGVFSGDTGTVDTTTAGGSGTDAALSLSVGGCEPNCGNLNYGVTAYSWNQSGSSVTAHSTTPGVLTSASNAGSSNSNLSLTLTKGQ